jgi:hypothetical protein
MVPNLRSPQGSRRWKQVRQPCRWHRESAMKGRSTTQSQSLLQPMTICGLGDAHDVVEALGSTQTGWASANDEYIDVAATEPSVERKHGGPLRRQLELHTDLHVGHCGELDGTARIKQWLPETQQPKVELRENPTSRRSQARERECLAVGLEGCDVFFSLRLAHVEIFGARGRYISTLAGRCHHTFARIRKGESPTWQVQHGGAKIN